MSVDGYYSVVSALTQFSYGTNVPTITVSLPTLSTLPPPTPPTSTIQPIASSISTTSPDNTDACFRLVELPLKSWLLEKKISDLKLAKQRVELVWEILPHLRDICTFEKVLSYEECDWLVTEAEAGANRRGGWLGDRHRGYATTDIRVNHVSEKV